MRGIARTGTAGRLFAIALRGAVVVGAVGWSSAAAPVARADVILDSPAAPAPVRAYGDSQAWSRFDAELGYQLVIRHDDVTTVAPIEPRLVPFDVDLGPDRRGEVRAVYSRCEREPVMSEGFPLWITGRGCDLYELSLRTGRERRLAVSSDTRSEALPTYWRGALAFVRAKASRGPRAVAEVRYKGYQERGSRVLAGGRTAGGGLPTALDLEGRNLAFGWQRLARRGEYETSVHVHAPIGHRRLVRRLREGSGYRRLALPSIHERSVYYGESRETGAARFLRYDVRSKRTTSAAAEALRPAPPDSIGGQLLSVSAGRTGLLYSGFVRPGRAGAGLCERTPSPCRVALSPGVAFR